MAHPETKQDRLSAITGVALLHLLLGYAFVTGLGVDASRQANELIRVFDVPATPPPEPSVPAQEKVQAPEGAASPPSRKARATPIVAPAPEIRLPAPPPVITVAKPTPAFGNDRSTGSSGIDGPGTGSGGQGEGIGSGGRGGGTGSGASARARRVSGSISGATDYPPSARRAGVQGSVSVRFTVRTDGTVNGCEVVRSTANAELNATTCRLIERRFRYEPARDGQGRPVPEIVSRTFDWLLPGRR